MLMLFCVVLIINAGLLAFVLMKFGRIKFARILGAIFGVLGVGFIIMGVFFWYRYTEVSVVDKDGDIFSIRVENHVERNEDSYAYFTCKYSRDELIEMISKQYGHLISYGEDIRIVDGNNAFMLTVVGEKRFFLEKRYEYCLEADYIELPDLERGGQCVRVAYPRAAIPDGIMISKEMPCGYDIDLLKEFYKSLPNAKVSEDDIEIDGVRIIFSERRVYFDLIPKRT